MLKVDIVGCMETAAIYFICAKRLKECLEKATFEEKYYDELNHGPVSRYEM